MKTFLDLLATEPKLNITVNGQNSVAALHDDLVFQANDFVQIDGVEVLPKYQYLAQNGALTINGPFYGWLHLASSQGWLLKPHLNAIR